mmetsp:Transcript_15508/g.21013  ORF Transcript_15508/g.21013 Transcript_15508/m.21013 type:complete len:82 (-) Transcript_15508:2716-2961(-)
MAPNGGAEGDKESKQRKFAQELQEQIRARDEARVKEEIRKRGKLPSYLFDGSEELPKPAYQNKPQMETVGLNSYNGTTSQH